MAENIITGDNTKLTGSGGGGIVKNSSRGIYVKSENMKEWGSIPLEQFLLEENMGFFDYFKEKKNEKERKENSKSYSFGEKIYQQGIIAYNNGNYEKAFELFSQAAKEHHYRAKYMVGACYEDGKGIARDTKKAFEIYSQIARERNADTFLPEYQNIAGVGVSKFRMGQFYLDGIEVPQDTTKGLEILSKMSAVIYGEEAAFLAYNELHRRYRNGGNGCPKDISIAHEWAIKALTAYEGFIRDQKIFHYNIPQAYSAAYCGMLEFVAFNLEEGRGVSKDLAKGTEYRRKAAEEFKDPSDAYFAGMAYEELGNPSMAKAMYNIAIKQGGDYAEKSQPKMNAILAKEKNANTARLERFLSDLQKSPVRGKLLDAAWLYYYGYLKTKPTEYGEIRTEKNFAKSREYILRLVKAEVKDKTPLYTPAVTDKKAEEAYFRGRMIEKSGRDFKKAVYYYKQAADKGHIEALFRMGHIYTYIMDNCASGDPYLQQAERNGRPRYYWHFEPTLALVQLAQQEDPEALRDLGRIYEYKKDINVSKLLFLHAANIYKKRILKEEPEAMYAYFELSYMMGRDGKEYLWRAADAGHGKALADLSNLSTSDAQRKKYRALADQTGAVKTAYSKYVNDVKFAEDWDRETKAWKYKQEQQKLAAQEAAEKAAMETKLDNYEKWYNIIESGKPFTNEEMFLFGQRDVLENLEDNAMRELIGKWID